LVSDVVWIDAAAVTVVVDRLRVLGDALVRDGGGLDRAVPAVPEDEYDLAGAVVAFDEAREAFERRLGLAVASTAAAVTSAVRGAQRADDGAMPAFGAAAGR
jgi:hypothetical protein